MNMGKKFYTYVSGGKGLHIEVFLQTKTKTRSAVDWQAIRYKFANTVLEGINFYTDPERGKFAVDRTKWGWRDDTMGSLLRVCGGKKKGYKTLIQGIPSRPIHMQEVKYPHMLYANTIATLYQTPSVKPKTTYPGRKMLENRDLPLCITSMIEQIQGGNHLQHLQNLAIAGHCCLAGLDINYIQDIYRNDPRYDPDKTAQQWWSVVKRIEKEPWKAVSCATIQAKGWCPSEEICRETKRLKQRECNVKGAGKSG
jgi:hypothetical protein